MDMTYKKNDVTLDELNSGTRHDPAIADHAARGRYHGKE
jgi:hypothetical protein